MKTKKWIVWALCVLMIVSLLPACSQDGGGSSAPESQGTEAQTGDSAAEESTAPSGERTHLSILAWDLGLDGQLPLGDNYWCDWIREEFGEPNNIELEWVVMPRWEEVTTLNVWMAGKEAPDIVYTYDINVVQNYITQGGLTDLTDLVAEYGQQLSSFIGEETMEYGVFDSRQMVIPSPRPVSGIVGSSIRGDWLDALGLDVPTTTQEWYDTMIAFRDEDPGNVGEQNIPCGMGMQEISFGYFNMLYSFIDPSLTQEELTLTYPFLYPGYKDGVRFLNQCYNEGLISPEFALDTDCSKMYSDITNGYVGFFTQNLLTGYTEGSYFDTMAENVEGAYYVACDPFTNSEGKHPKLANQPYGKFIMVPAFSESAKEAVMYLDWMLVPENLMRLSLGDEGVHYTIDEEGIFHINADYDGPDKLSASNNYEYRFIVEDIWYGSQEATYKNWTSKCNSEQADIQFEMAMTDSRQDPWFFPYFKKAVQSEAQYATSMTDKYKEMFTILIMCSPDEFDSQYDNLVNEFMSLYGNEVCEERAQVWAETME